MTSILITGAQGFLGRAIAKTLNRVDVNLFLTGRREEQGIYQCDLLSRSELVSLVNYVNPDLIINCAAEVPQSSIEYQSNIFANNSISIVRNLLAFTSCPIMQISSMTVYGNKSCQRGVWHESDAGFPSSEYGLSKWESELLVSADPRPTLCLRIPGLYGEQKKSGLIYNIIKSAKSGSPFSLPSMPVLWAAMHVNDAALVISQLTYDHNFHISSLNCGYRGVYSINILTELVSQILGISSIPMSIQHPRFCFDLTLLDSLSLTPKCTLKSSLSSFIAEF